MLSRSGSDQPTSRTKINLFQLFLFYSFPLRLKHTVSVFFGFFFVRKNNKKRLSGLKNPKKNANYSEKINKFNGND